ncbi:MAG: SH3 domain-containing protein [Oscillospiraceae bacterium]|nr:SH3 domain-containing protein [Oscillospiraceae bacterium]
MEGRRVTQRNKKYNPLFILFLCLVAAVIILLVVSIVFGSRLKSADKKLKAAEAQVQELNDTVSRLNNDLEAAKAAATTTPKVDPLPAIPGTSTDPSVPGTSDTPASPVAWLDLSGHNELKVKPTTLLDGYVTYYTTAGVNMRSGPGTSYDRITTVDYGEAVQVAAKENNWSFVKYENKFGWISSDYLSTSEPAGAGGQRAESTSGSIRR